MKEARRHLNIHADEEALAHLARCVDGDARKALNALDIAALTTPADIHGQIRITLDIAEQSIQKKAIIYDGHGGEHFDIASACQKSMRGSDPDAALYWLGRMMVAGEDLRFIARRMVICASEVVGLADPTALVVANAARQVAEFIGLPEAQQRVFGDCGGHQRCGKQSHHSRSETFARSTLPRGRKTWPWHWLSISA